MLRFLSAQPRLAKAALFAAGALASGVLIAFLIEWSQRARVVFERDVVGAEARFAGAYGWSASPAGVVWLQNEQVYRVSPDGTVRASAFPRQSATSTSQSRSGEVAIGFFKRDGTERSELHLARLDSEGRTRFDVALREMRDETCGTGHFDPVVSADDSITWVVARGRVLAFDQTGHRLVSTSPCGCSEVNTEAGTAPCGCNSLRLWAHQHGVVVAIWKYDTSQQELVWLDNNGAVQTRTTINMAPDAFDGEGTLYTLAQGQRVPCANMPDDKLRIVQIDRAGCHAGPVLPVGLLPTDEVLPLAATKQHVYIASHTTDGPRGLRWLRGRSPGGISIHRFSTDGQYIDSRWAPRSQAVQFPSFIDGAFTVLEGRRTLLSLKEAYPLQEQGSRVSVVGLDY